MSGGRREVRGSEGRREGMKERMAVEGGEGGREMKANRAKGKSRNWWRRREREGGREKVDSARWGKRS